MIAGSLNEARILSPAHTDGYFPSISIPVVSVIWQYTGLSAKEIEQRMVYTDERALMTTVNNIEHIESTWRLPFVAASNRRHFLRSGYGSHSRGRTALTNINV